MLMCMLISAVSSLSLWARDLALQKLVAARASGTALTIVSIDVLENNSEHTTVRIASQTQQQTRHREVTVADSCNQCTTLGLLQEIFAITRDHDLELLVLLPTGVSLSTAMKAAHATENTLHQAVLALDISTVEDQLWDGAALAHSAGGECEDERTAGEFLIGDLALADSAVVAQIPLTHCTVTEKERATELLEHLAPHLQIFHDSALDSVCTCHDQTLAAQRYSPGYVPLTKQPTQSVEVLKKSQNFSTVLVQSSNLLDCEKFSKVLAPMVEGACRVRGTVWLDQFPPQTVALEGIGPAVWLQHVEKADPEPRTLFTITGAQVDPQEVQELIESCVIDGDAIVNHLLS